MTKTILNKYLFLKRINRKYFVNFLNKYKINKLFFKLAKIHKMHFYSKTNKYERRGGADIIRFFRIDIIERPMVFRKKTKYCRYFFFRQFFKSFYGYLKIKKLKKLSRRASYSKRAPVVFLRLFESRLDVFLFRLGLVRSTTTARQLIMHGNVIVNGRIVRNYAYSLQVGEPVTFIPEKVKEFKKMVYLNFKNQVNFTHILPGYIEVDYRRFCFTIGIFRDVTEIPFPFRMTS